MSVEHDAMDIILRARSFALMGFWLWGVVYGVLIVASVVGPGLSATGLLNDKWSKVSAAAGAITASLFAALKPSEQLTKYDAAVQMLWQTRVAYVVRTIDDAEVAKEVQAAIGVMKVHYYSVRPADEPDQKGERIR